jgi:hypothetical protein
MPSDHDDLWEIYNAINEWVRFADTKAGAVLAAQGIIVAVALPPLLENRVSIVGDCLLCTLLVLSALATLLSVALSLKCVTPRLKVGEAKSLIFFGHIAQAFNDPDAYHATFERYRNDEKGLAGHIAHQVWANSKVAWTKYKDSTWALRFFGMAVALDATLAGISFMKA